jgi:epoxyqueuosine reductase
MAQAALEDRIREEAQRQGFFKLGIAAPGLLPRKEYFERWLSAGCHGGMSYLARQAAKRGDPSRVLNGVKSILVLAMNYYAGQTPVQDPRIGKISRYAWNADYHEILTDRLASLLAFITEQVPGARGLCYADAGPIAEKVWGAESALGWMGKHTNLITRERGSWFFLGVILLDVVLQCDARESGHCGSCSRCIDACPTGAIRAPYELDARLCISYLTIELRGSIPRVLRPAIGNRIFGCDDCQEACPWNRFAVSTPERAFWPRMEDPIPELISLAGITEREFGMRFQKSPILRAGREGLVRNVVVALGNSRDPAAVPALTAAIEDPSPLVRGHAAWALGCIPGSASAEALERAAFNESDASVLGEIRNCGDR